MNNLPADERSKLAEMGFVDPRRFGAKGDGNTDDTPAFQSSLEEIGFEPGTLILARAT